MSIKMFQIIRTDILFTQKTPKKPTEIRQKVLVKCILMHVNPHILIKCTKIQFKKGKNPQKSIKKLGGSRGRLPGLDRETELNQRENIPPTPTCKYAYMRHPTCSPIHSWLASNPKLPNLNCNLKVPGSTFCKLNFLLKLTLKSAISMRNFSGESVSV